MAARTRAADTEAVHAGLPPRGVHTVVLVEGDSDRCAVETLAHRGGRDLTAEGVAVVPMGGATNVGHFLVRLGPPGLGLRMTGVCDAAENRYFARALNRVGLGTAGFFTCVRDLEDELIRALGPDRVQQVIESAGDLTAFRRLQKQPAQRGRPVEDQLQRFLACGSGRKIRYASLLVEALEPDQVPGPLAGLLAASVSSGR